MIASGVRNSWEALAANLRCSARKPDAMGERPVRRDARGVGDASQRGEHPAGENPPSHEPQHQEERRHQGRLRSESAQKVIAAGTCREMAAGSYEWWVGYITQEEHPHGSK